MRKNRRIWSTVLALCFLLTLFPATARAVEISDVSTGSSVTGAEGETAELMRYLASGSLDCKDGEIFWFLDEDGALTFEGSGAMVLDVDPGSDDRISAMKLSGVTAVFSDISDEYG